MRNLRNLVWQLLVLVCLAPGAQAQGERDPFELGVESYRRGAYAEAEAHWLDSFAVDLDDEERARVAYNLGNAAWRRDQYLVAVGWYSLAVELAPRDRDAWHNLELARGKAELEPADRGDLSDTLDRLTSSLLPGEARRLALAGFGLLFLVLLGEALRGGVLWRRLALCAFLLAALCAVPWIRTFEGSAKERFLVIRAPSVALRSEPKLTLDPIASIEAGAEVRRIDRLPGWIRVLTPDGERGWLQAETLFGLDLDQPGPAKGS